MAREHKGNKGVPPMLSDLAAVLHRSRATLAEDTLGALALFSLLIGGLSLPVL